MTPPSNSRSGDRRSVVSDDRALIQSYLAQHPRLTAGALSAARHFLKWATTHGITHTDLDAAAVDRFARHRCRCGRYSPGQLRDPRYVTDVRRFLRHLENAGAVAVPDGVERLDKYLAAFAVRLEAVGYGKPAYDARLSQRDILPNGFCSRAFPFKRSRTPPLNSLPGTIVGAAFEPNAADGCLGREPQIVAAAHAVSLISSANRA